MLLEQEDIERYARQIILEEIGVRGQRRLLRSRVRVTGTDPGCEAARVYLRAAGVSVTGDVDEAVDCAIALGTDTRADHSLRLQTETTVPLIRFDCDGASIRIAVSSNGRPPVEPVAPHTTPGQSDPASDALCAAAGCDAANTAIALLLAWPVPHSATGIRLA